MIMTKVSLNESFMRVSWALNKLTLHSLNEERDDKSFIYKMK